MQSTIRAIVRATLYGLWSSFFLPIQMVALPLNRSAAKRLPLLYHRMCCRLFGIQVQSHGLASRDHPVLFVANHTSYLDIVILGSLVPGSFVAKAEIAGWPFFGFLAKLQRTVFIDRRGSKAADHRDEIGARLAAGDDLILFPEGTSGDGNRILPFKSALFSVAERQVRGRPIMVQPVSIAYSHIDGLPIGREWRPYFAWYGDMGLTRHIRTMIAMGKLTVQVAFHPPFNMADLAREGLTASGLRKLMADRSHAAIVEGHGRALFASGRPALAIAAKTSAALAPNVEPPTPDFVSSPARP